MSKCCGKFKKTGTYCSSCPNKPEDKKKGKKKKDKKKKKKK